MSTPLTTSIHGLIFDMDGLLVDSEPLAEQAISQFLRLHGHELRPDLMSQVLGRRLPDAVTLLIETYGLTAPLDDLVKTYADLRLSALRGHLQPMPGAAALITFARAAQLKLGLATSSLRTHADLSLAEAKLAGLFDAEATGDEVSRGKPAPDIFILAARRLALDPAACVVFEDAPAGVAAAKAAGMRCVCVPNVKTRPLPFPVPADVILPDLGSAIDWLADQGIACSNPVATP